jgi:hypothetical protein
VKKNLIPKVDALMDPISDDVVRMTIQIYGYKEVLQIMARMTKKASKGNPHPSTDEFYTLLTKGLRKVVDVCWTSKGR